MKLVTIEARIPDLEMGKPADQKLSRQTSRGKGSSWPLALYRAAKQLRSQLARKNYTNIQMQIYICEAPKESASGDSKVRT